MRWILLSLLLVACADDADEPKSIVDTVEEKPQPKPPPAKPGAPPPWVQYDHILITFRGAHENVYASRTKEEARQLAESVFERAKSGLVSFESLKQEYSDDISKNGVKLGPYVMLNEGTPRKAAEHIPRKNAAKAFGDMLFRLKVGEVGMCGYDERTSPFGWHIAKRLR